VISYLSVSDNWNVRSITQGVVWYGDRRLLDDTVLKEFVPEKRKYSRKLHNERPYYLPLQYEGLMYSGYNSYIP